MPSFTSLNRRRSEPVRIPGQALTEAERAMLPRGFEAVWEALVSDTDVAAASAEVGRTYALSGASLGEALDGLHATCARVLGREPAYASVKALSLAWSEATLEFLNQLSCEDPLTGMASLAHVRTRLSEIYREAENAGHDVRTREALVVVEVRSVADDHLSRALTLAQVADAIRTVFSGGETIGRAGAVRGVAVVHRRYELGGAVAVLREYLADLGLSEPDVRVWIEGLPGSFESASRLLDELAR